MSGKSAKGPAKKGEKVTIIRATRILNADVISFYISLMSFFLYISYYSVYFYSNLYYKHK